MWGMTSFLRLLKSGFLLFFILVICPAVLWAAVAQTVTQNSLSADKTVVKPGLPQMLKIEESPGQGVTFSFTPVLRQSQIKIQEKGYAHFSLRDGGFVETVGFPRLPFISRLVAIPEGAKVSVTLGASSSRILNNISVEPAPPRYEDNDDYVALPVKEDAKAYASNELFPAAPYEFIETGRLRGVRVGVLRLYPAQYRAAKKQLVVYDNLNVQIRFQGVIATAPKSKWTAADIGIVGMFANSKTLSGLIQSYVFPSSVPALSLSDDYMNLEYLIVTHPDFEDAADTLADWKNEKGIRTVVQDLDTTGWTVEEIDTYVSNAYSLSGGTLKYLLIMGDSDYVPVSYYEVCADGSTTCTTLDIASDLFYAEFDGDIYPELAYGRIPSNTLDEAYAAVDKILSYEQDPPSNFYYYQNFTFAGYFQDNGSDGGSAVANDGIDDRSFIETMETVRDALLLEGKTVDRIYTPGSSYLTTNPDGPQYYEDGTTPLPADLLVQYDAGGTNIGFPWDGDTTQIVDDFNSNRSLLFHRDHGNYNGWSSPTLHSSDLSSLTNTSFPVLFNVSCLTGRYDHETGWWSDQTEESFAEQSLALANHGPASLVTAARATSTSLNNTMSKGLFDALWDGVVSDSDHHDASTGADVPITRLGDVLNYAKLYVDLHHSSIDQHFHHYYVAGDPTLEILRSMPLRSTTAGFKNLFDVMDAVKTGRPLDLQVIFREYELRDVVITLYIDPTHYVSAKEIFMTAATDQGMGRTYQFDTSELLKDQEWLQRFTAAPESFPVHVTVRAKGYAPLRYFPR